MRSRITRRHLSFALDVAIAIGVAFSATFFILVMEFRAGHGELTRAALTLLANNPRVAHGGPAITTASQRN